MYLVCWKSERGFRGRARAVWVLVGPHLYNVLYQGIINVVPGGYKVYLDTFD